MDLREELDLANAAAAALEVVAGAEALTGLIMAADPAGEGTDLADRAEIERAPPHERPDRGEETLTQRDVARRRARADEGRALPRQRARFVIGDRRSTGSAIGVTSGEGRSRRSTRNT